MNDIERNTLLLLCAMFHGFFIVPVGQLSSSSRDSCRRAVALQLLSAAVRGGFQGLAHRCRAWGHDHSVMASRTRYSATVARQSPSVNVPRPYHHHLPPSSPVGGMFRSMERISVKFNCTPDQMFFFLNSWLRPSRKSFFLKKKNCYFQELNLGFFHLTFLSSPFPLETLLLRVLSLRGWLPPKTPSWPATFL